MNTIDLRDQKVITGRDIEDAVKTGAKEILLGSSVVLTPTARDLARKAGVQLNSKNGRSNTDGVCHCAGGKCTCSEGLCTCPPGTCSCKTCSAKKASKGSTSKDKLSRPEAIFNSPEANAIKEEIVRVGKKLWAREYVDGNGGNISYRISDEYVICTPTLMSKGDLTVDDLGMVDLEGNQVAGTRPRTSEILMHLEIFKAVPEAKGMVHCHPAHATAYAITGMVPPNCIIPETEIFVGTVALSPYETPGTKQFAEKVVPYAKEHNTILLANHGIVCWADTVTHAEWYVEVIDNYCRTLMLAAQLGTPITRIPGDKTMALLEIKKKMGLPDERFGWQECQLCDLPEFAGGITIPACKQCPAPCGGKEGSCQDTEALIQSITDQIMTALGSKD